MKNLICQACKLLQCVFILIQHFVSWQQQQQNLRTIFMFWSEAATTYDDIFKQNKAFPVYCCLFTTFRYLFSSAPDLDTKGDVFFKLKLAVDFNIRNEEKPESAATVRKRLTTVVTSSQQQLLQTQTAGNSNKNDNETFVKSLKTTLVQKSLHNMISPCKQTQTDSFSTETLRRFESILTGPHFGAFYQIMDIFLSGYGKSSIDTDLLFVRFVYEEKIKFWKKWISFKH